jgi:hypothetical protein
VGTSIWFKLAAASRKDLKNISFHLIIIPNSQHRLETGHAFGKIDDIMKIVL